MKINGGATLWARQTIDSDIFFNKPDKWFKIWFYLINEVNHKDNKQFTRGGCFMRYEWIMNKTKATKGEVDHCLRWLKSAKMVATTKATRGFNLKILNYNTFQTLESYKSDKKSDGNSDLKAKQKRNKSDTINNNGKNDNNVNNGNNKDKDSVKHHTILCEQIINYLNIEAGKNYLLTTPITIKLINARLKEGYSLDNFKRVIDIKIEEWKGRFTKDGKNMEDWLRPQTLFGNKFESYLNQNNISHDPNRFDFINEEENLIE